MTAMRIIDLQRRLREIGRIRTGDIATSQNGKTRPRKLERFRLTSRDRKVIDVAAATWGGDVTEWQAPDGQQWQVYLQSDELAVIVPPGDMSFSQSYEQWTAGGCKVRCDGAWDHIADQACACDPSDRDCNIHTRLSVMVSELPGIGVWRLETHSYYAAVELGGLVDLCAAQAAAGVMIPARLRLEQRSVKRVDKGKVVTRRFAVPVLDLDVHPLALGAGGTAVVGQLAEGGVSSPLAALAPPPSITPVPEPERVLRPTVAAQVDAVNEERPAGQRTQTPVSRTGLKPRTAEQAASTTATTSTTECSICGESYRDGRPVRRGRGDESTYVHTVHHSPAEDVPDGGQGSEVPADREAVDHSEDTSEPATARPGVVANGAGQKPPAVITVRQVAQKAGVVFKADYDAAAKGGKTKIVDRLRHALVHAQTGGEKTSTAECTPHELLAVWQRLDDITEGRLAYDIEPDSGVTFTTQSGKIVTVMWTEIEPDTDDKADTP